MFTFYSHPCIASCGWTSWSSTLCCPRGETGPESRHGATPAPTCHSQTPNKHSLKTQTAFRISKNNPTSTVIPKSSLKFPSSLVVIEQKSLEYQLHQQACGAQVPDATTWMPQNQKYPLFLEKVNCHTTARIDPQNQLIGHQHWPLTTSPSFVQD